jgi:hypothetical protein
MDSDPVADDPSAVSRFSIVQTKIAEAAATGKLVTGVRAIGGGDVERLPPGAWQTEGEALGARFALGRMISTMPFSTDIFDGAPFMRPYHGYVFVESAGLARLVRGHNLKSIVASGEPGRPTSRSLFETEFSERVERGAIEASLAEEARVLFHLGCGNSS